MTYEEAIAFLNDADSARVRFGLTTTKKLLDLLGNPENRLKFVHVAGTNGKGSTAAFMESILRTAGYRTGLYTSPHIVRFNERIRVNNQDITDIEIAELTEQVYKAAEKLEDEGIIPTVFERITALALLYFAEKGCDIVVLEVGMGGRLDATNVIPEAEVSLITSISWDHMQYLGNTLPAIAKEKAGIIKKNGHVVSYPEPADIASVLIDRADEQKADITILSRAGLDLQRSTISGQDFTVNNRKYHIALLGDYQVLNAYVAIAGAQVLQREGWKISDQDIQSGVRDTKWPGRIELIMKDPYFLVDGAHNPDGVHQLSRALRYYFPGKRITFIAGVLADKDYKTMFREMEPIASRFLTVTPESDRALPGSELAKLLRSDGCQAECFSSWEDAADDCLCGGHGDEIICAFGSLYYIGLVRNYVLKKNNCTSL